MTRMSFIRRIAQFAKPDDHKGQGHCPIRTADLITSTNVQTGFFFFVLYFPPLMDSLCC